ncbi:cyclin F-box [Salix suchowensis]|nr:cyclin F-box [Salix suchowensis]
MGVRSLRRKLSSSEQSVFSKCHSADKVSLYSGFNMRFKVSAPSTELVSNGGAKAGTLGVNVFSMVTAGSRSLISRRTKVLTLVLWAWPYCRPILTFDGRLRSPRFAHKPTSIAAYERIASGAGLSAAQINQLQTADASPNGGHCEFDQRDFVSGVQLLSDNYATILAGQGVLNGVNVNNGVVGNENLFTVAATGANRATATGGRNRTGNRKGAKLITPTALDVA